MHRVFGKKEKAEYLDRTGAYLIPIKEGKIAVVKTPKGLFFLGGGKEPGETDWETICRECLEEAGCEARAGEKVCSAEMYIKHQTLRYFHPIQAYYLGEISEKVQEPLETDHQLIWMEYSQLKGNLFVEMQNWALEQCWREYEKNEF